MVEDRIDRRLVAIHDLQDAVGQPGLGHQLGQHQRHRGVAFAGFQDEGVAAGDGGGEFPHRDHRGKVERRDPGHHAQRLAHRIDVDAGARAVGVFALQQVRCTDAELDHLEPPLHVAPGVGQGLAMLAAQRLGQLVHVAVQQADEFHQHPRPALRVGGGPAGLRRPRACNRGGQLCRAGKGHARLHLAGGRVVDIGEAARLSGHARTVDEMAELLHGVLPQSWIGRTLAEPARSEKAARLRT
jgi:hypothetical protein